MKVFEFTDLPQNAQEFYKIQGNQFALRQHYQVPDKFTGTVVEASKEELFNLLEEVKQGQWDCITSSIHASPYQGGHERVQYFRDHTVWNTNAVSIRPFREHLLDVLPDPAGTVYCCVRRQYSSAQYIDDQEYGYDDANEELSTHEISVFALSPQFVKTLKGNL